jgi:hypothetical protein
MFSALCRQRDYRPDLIATVTRHGWIGIEVNEHSDIPLERLMFSVAQATASYVKYATTN